MFGDLQIVSFDTTAHNRLVDDGARSEAAFAALKYGFHFRFAGLSIEEMMATPALTRRVALFTQSGRLQFGSTDSVYPHNELMKRLVLGHFRNPTEFDWRNVDVRAWEYEQEISRREFVWDEVLAREQRARQLQDFKDYENMFRELRPELAEVFNRHGEPLPLRFREVIARMEKEGSSFMWNMGKLLYDRAVETDITEARIREFINVCPPFRALLYGMMLSWFDRAVRDRHLGQKFQSGRNDIFMSVHLPYCEKFITAEKNGEQEKCLREIAVVAGLETDILSYDDFCDSFLVTV